MSTGAWVEAVLAVAPLIGVPLLCWLDPAGLYETERKRRSAQR